MKNTFVLLLQRYLWRNVRWGGLMLLWLGLTFVILQNEKLLGFGFHALSGESLAVVKQYVRPNYSIPFNTSYRGVDAVLAFALLMVWMLPVTVLLYSGLAWVVKTLWELSWLDETRGMVALEKRTRAYEKARAELLQLQPTGVTEAEFLRLAQAREWPPKPTATETSAVVT
ncbi:MAG: hypothetical protein WAX89_05930 [Alphaproteobacteria bacterium]